MIGDAAAVFGMLGAFAVVTLIIGSIFLWDIITRSPRLSDPLNTVPPKQSFSDDLREIDPCGLGPQGAETYNTAARLALSHVRSSGVRRLDYEDIVCMTLREAGCIDSPPPLEKRMLARRLKHRARGR